MTSKTPPPKASLRDRISHRLSTGKDGRHIDPEAGRSQGLKQFLDEKSFKPGLGTFKR